MSATTLADMVFGGLIGFLCGGLIALYLVRRQIDETRARTRRLLDPTTSYLSEN